MRSLALFIFLACSWNVNAETWAVASIGSYHIQRDKNYCEFNPGIGIEHDISERTRFVFGQYNNSFCKPSGYVGVSYTALTYGRLRLGAAFILVSGYEKEKAKDQEIMPAPLGVIAYELDKYGVNFILAPPYGDFAGAIGIQGKFRF